MLHATPATVAPDAPLTPLADAPQPRFECPHGLSAPLAALAREFEAAHAAYLIASERLNEAERRYDALYLMPEDLNDPLWFLSDPVPLKLILRAQNLRQFVERQRSAAASSAHGHSLMQDTTCAEALIPIAEALIPHVEAYEAALADAERAIGCRACKDKFDDAVSAVHEAAQRIMAAPVCSAPDFALKARILRDWVCPNLKNRDLLEVDERYGSAARVLDDALALISGNAPEQP
jgi:hypothetical protein